MAVAIYAYEDYKKFVQDYVKDLGEPWGYWGKLAKAIHCQPAYLSRCLKDKTHLTVDQILALGRYWALSQGELEYLVNLLELGRAATEDSRRYFRQRLKHLRDESENLKTRFKRDSFDLVKDQALYYSHWLWMAVHFATSIEKLQTVHSLAERFGAPHAQIQNILEKLLSLGLVRKEGNHWIFHSGEFHLGKDSPLIPTHHQNWRGKAVTDSQFPHSDGLHYSAVYTLSEKDFQRLKTEILKWIEASREIVGASQEEEIVCFNLDFFRV